VPRHENGKETGVESRGGTPGITWTDDRLVRACLDGHDQAWAALIEKYKNLIYSVPLKYGTSPSDAADVFQSVCLKLYSELPKLRQSAALRGWLLAVTTHETFHTHKKQRRRGEQALTDFEETQLGSDPRAVPVIEEAEKEQVLRDAVRALSPRCQEIVRLLFYEEPPVPYRDLAKRLGLATGSIGFIRGRCLKHLQRALEKAGF
jgi:RNA polymerase sigma factor (sigma-70 family)